MPVLDDIFGQITPGRTYQFAFGPRGFAVSRLESSSLLLAYEVLPSSVAIPLDGGLVDRDDKEVRWFGELPMFASEFDIPKPGQRAFTVEIASIQYPGLLHRERSRR